MFTIVGMSVERRGTKQTDVHLTRREFLPRLRVSLKPRKANMLFPRKVRRQNHGVNGNRCLPPFVATSSRASYKLSIKRRLEY
jgi:hypothetical protein